MIEFLVGLVTPQWFVPCARGTTVILFLLQSFKISDTSFVVLGKTTAKGIS